MRIGPFILLIVISIHLSSGTCKKQVRQLEKRIRLLEKRVAAVEKALCSRSSCPAGFVSYKNYCLLFIRGKSAEKSWQQSRKDCQERGADLVTINSRRKEKFIARYINNNFAGEDVEMYTGLIVTNEHLATSPHNQKFVFPSIINKNSRANKSLRWVSTNQAIQTDDLYFKYHQRAPFVSWSPGRIRGTSTGPKNKDRCLFHSCVTVTLSKSPNQLSSGKRKFMLDWWYTCSARKLNYICETKRQKSSCG